MAAPVPIVAPGPTAGFYHDPRGHSPHMEFGAGRSAGAGSGSRVAGRAIRTVPVSYVRQLAQPLDRSIGRPRALAVDHELFYAYAFLHRRGRVGAAHQNERETSAGWVSAVVCPP